MFTTLIAVLFTALLVVGVPALSYSTARNRQIREMPRLALYMSAIFSQWLLTVVGVGVVLLVDRRVFQQGFAAFPLFDVLGWAVSISLISILALSLVIFCEERGWLPGNPSWFIC